MHVFNGKTGARDRVHCDLCGFGPFLTGEMGDEKMIDTSNIKPEWGWQWIRCGTHCQQLTKTVQ